MRPTPGAGLPCVFARRTVPGSRWTAAAAFTLVEVCLALGIVAVVLVPLVTMVPIGLEAQRQAVDTTVAAQIIQKISADAEQADFNSLVTTDADGVTNAPAATTRYFNVQAKELMDASGNPDANSVQRVYDVQASVVLDSSAGRVYDARKPVSDAAVAPTATSPVNLVTIKIQIASNPGRRANQFASGKCSTYFIYVARNEGAAP